MKTKLFLTISLFSLFLLTSCNKDDNTDDSQKEWREGNESQFKKIERSSEYKRLDSQSGRGFILYKIIKEGDGKTPIFTDQVRVLYTGWYKVDWNKEDVIKDDNGVSHKNKYIFSSTQNINDLPATLSVKGLIDGFSTALQKMKVGDKWEIWIPWNMGYGNRTTNSIPSYTTLAYEIELVEVL